MKGPSLRKLRRRLRIWWLSITTPDNPINVTIEQSPYQGVECYVECPNCSTQHHFRKPFNRKTIDSQQMHSRGMSIHNKRTSISFHCFVCRTKDELTYSSFREYYTNGVPYTHRIRITDTNEE